MRVIFTRHYLITPLFLICILYNPDRLNATPAPPVITNLHNDFRVFRFEGQMLLDGRADAVLTAGDTPSFDTGSLVVSVTVNGNVMEDQLGVLHQGNGSGQIGVSGRDIYYEGVNMATMTGGIGYQPLRIRFNNSANATKITALIRRLIYSNNRLVPEFGGEKIISVTVSDANGAVSIAAGIILVVRQENLFAVASDNFYNVGLNDTINIAAPGFLFNDFDPEGSPLAIIGMPTTPNHLSLHLFSTGAFWGHPSGGYTGLDSFTYRVMESRGGPVKSTVIINIGGINQTPVAANDSFVTAPNIPVGVPRVNSILLNDNDPDSDPLRIFNVASLVAGPSHGTVTLRLDGSFRYVPDNNYAGTDIFTYSNCDGEGACSQATVSITVLANTTPLAYDDYTDVVFNNPAAGNVLPNDSDPDGNTLAAALVSGPANGTVLLNTDGSFTYTPGSDYSGPDHFVYQLCDNNIPSFCDTAVAFFFVAGNSRPFAARDSIYAEVNDPVTGNVLTNDTDTEGDDLVSFLLANPLNGYIVLNANGSFTYTPNNYYSGLDSIIYKVCDDNTPSLCDTTTAIFIISSVSIDATYPVPANKILNVRFKDVVRQETKIKLIDITGGILRNIKLPVGMNVLTIDVTGLPPGVYFLSVMSKNVASTRKIIIAR